MAMLNTAMSTTSRNKPMTETWKAIKGYEGIYEISNLGRVRNIKRKNKIVKSYTTKLGYQRVQLSKNGKFKNLLIHRLVADAFLPKPDNKDVINHKDFDRSNNNVENLEWLTYKENSHYSMDRMVEAQLKVRKSSTKHHNIYRNHKHFVVRVKRYGQEIINKTFITLDEAVLFLKQQGI